MEDTERHLGPFLIRGQNFSVVLHEKRLPGASDPRFAQTLSTLEIRDEKEAVLYDKTFTFGIEKGKLERSLKASASLLSGKYFTGLLISYRLKLSTGEDAEAWQIFGYQDGRYKAQDAKFRIFDKPLRSDHPMGNPPAEMKLVTPTGVGRLGVGFDANVAADLMQVAFRELWLKVRIDDDDQKEGWIHSDEDFAAIGLPSRSPEP